MQFKTKSVKLSDIAIDGGTQQREKINNEIVAEYAEAMRCGAKFPAVTLFFDGVRYWLADGFHRFWASKAVPALDILADVREGTKRDAQLFSAGANHTHGQHLTAGEKAKSVRVLLMDEEWSKWTDEKISKHCHCSQQYVSKLRKPKPILEKPHTTVVCENANIGNETKTVTVAASPSEATPSTEKKSEPPVQPEVPLADDETSIRIDMLNGALEALNEENESLRNQIAAMLFTGTDEEKAEYLDRLNHLTAENKRLEIMNRGLTEARDRVMRENVSLRKQGEYAARKLKAIDRAAA